MFKASKQRPINFNFLTIKVDGKNILWFLSFDLHIPSFGSWCSSTHIIVPDPYWSSEWRLLTKWVKIGRISNNFPIFQWLNVTVGWVWEPGSPHWQTRLLAQEDRWPGVRQSRDPGPGGGRSQSQGPGHVSPGMDKFLGPMEKSVF